MSVDYPQMAATRGRIEPAPRRVRGYLGHVLVFDTSAARYVWEVPYYPQYYIPLADVRMEFLRDENHPQRVQLGPSRPIRPTSLSSIWSPPRRRRCVRTRGRRRAIGLCASATPCTATWPGRITIHCPPLPRSPAWWRFTTRRSTSPSTASPCRGRTLSSASAWFVRRLAAASMVNLI